MICARLVVAQDQVVAQKTKQHGKSTSAVSQTYDEESNSQTGVDRTDEGTLGLGRENRCRCVNTG